jgi:hypothetical protein
MTDLAGRGLPSNVRIESYTVEDPLALDCGKAYTHYFVDAPFSLEQVQSLNAYQAARQGHPFTCGRDRRDGPHRAYQKKQGGDFGQLVAREAGWVCPVPGCSYVQGWAWLHMSDWSWRRSDESAASEPGQGEREEPEAPLL